MTLNPVSGPAETTAPRLGGGAPWDEPGWIDEVTAWISSRADLAGRIELLDRYTKPWSVVARIPTAAGHLWFKELGPGLAFEPALTTLLAQRAPELMPEVVAAEGTRMLTVDAGPHLRAVLKGREPADWEAAIARYAEFQFKLAPIVNLPLPDLRPEALARRFGQRVDPLAAELGDTISMSLVHLGLSDRNICLRAGGPVVIDWASAAVAHPFCALVKPLKVLVRKYGAEPGGREVLRLRDAYLEPWTTLAPAKELRRIATAAYLLGILCHRAMKEHKLTSLPVSVRQQYDTKDCRLRNFEKALRNPHRLGAPGLLLESRPDAPPRGAGPQSSDRSSA